MPGKFQDLAQDTAKLFRGLSDYHSFLTRILAEPKEAAGDGPLEYAVATLDRELRALDETRATWPDHAELAQADPSWRGYEMLAYALGVALDLAPYFDRDGAHQAELNEAFDDEPLLRTQDQTQVKRYHTMIDRQLRAVIPELSDFLEERDKADGASGRSGQESDIQESRSFRDSSAEAKKGEDDMATSDNAQDDRSFDSLVDALSRLQPDAGGGWGGAGGNAYRDFGLRLDQQFQTILGMPDLKSDGARAMAPEDLVAKLLDGLDRTIVTRTVGNSRSYSFNPLRARSAAIGTEAGGLGAQAVTADTILALKAPIVGNLLRLTPENVYSEQDEAEDLRQAIELGLDSLASEASAELGAFDVWAEELFEQIFRDLMSLAALYGIRTEEELQPFQDYLTRRSDANETPETLLSAVPIRSARDRVLRDPDIGILAAEANDKAIAAILWQLATMWALLVGDDSLGPLLGRVRMLNEAVTASVLAARGALERAGISVEDQTVSFIGGNGRNSINLRRLLSWIETESLTARPALLRPDLNGRDLDRLRSARRIQWRAMEEALKLDFASVTLNRYSTGRRHLAELERHLDQLVRLYDRLVQESSGTGQRPRSGRH